MLDMIFGLAGSAGAAAAMVSAYFDLKRRKGELTQEDFWAIKEIGLEKQAHPSQSLVASMAVSPSMSNKRLEGIIGGIKDGIDKSIKDLNRHLNPNDIPYEREREKGVSDISREICWQLKQLKKFGGLNDGDLIELRQQLGCQ